MVNISSKDCHVVFKAVVKKCTRFNLACKKVVPMLYVRGST